MHLYQNKMNFRKEHQKARKIAPETYNQIKDAFEYEHVNGRKRIRYESVILPMREEMQVMENIQTLIFGSSPLLMPEVTPDKSMSHLKEFVLVKRVLNAC